MREVLFLRITVACKTEFVVRWRLATRSSTPLGLEWGRTRSKAAKRSKPITAAAMATNLIFLESAKRIEVQAAQRSAEAPASTDGANLKLQGQSLALTPGASSGCSAMCSFHHKNLRRSLSGFVVAAGRATIQIIKPRMARMGTDKKHPCDPCNPWSKSPSPSQTSRFHSRSALAAERPKLSDPARETHGLQPGRDGRVRWSAG